MDRQEFLGCHVRCIHWALGKGAKAAVRVEVDLLWTTVLEQGFDFTDNEVHGFDLGRTWVTNPQANLCFRRQISQHLDAPGPFGGILQDELLYLHATEIGYQWVIRSLQQHALLTAPVAATD